MIAQIRRGHGVIRSAPASAWLAQAVFILVLSCCLLVSGCASTSQLDRIPQFRQAVVSADQQSAQSFGQINAFLRERQIDRVALGDALDEQALATVLDPEDVDKWHRAFLLLDRYGQSLQTLLDPQRREGVEAELTGVGEAFGRLREDDLPSGLTAGFVSLGGLLLQAKTQKDAMAAIRTAHPGVQEALATMMEAIGKDREEGLRATVDSSWKLLQAEHIVRFKHANTRSEKRQLTVDFVALLNQRDAQDRSLASLRRSLELLADAHAELAAGRTAGARELLEILQTERSRWSERKEAIEKQRASEAAS